MASKPNRSSEGDLAKVVLDILADQPSGEATIATLIKEVPNRHKLTPEDWEPSKTRKNESLWEQIVRNIASHDDIPGNIIAEGYAERIKDGYSITDAGRLRVKARHR